MHYASLGDIVFKVYSYLEHRETNEYAVAKHRTIFAPSSLQFLGDELLSLEINVGFHRDFCNPLEEYQKLKDIAKEGLPQKLIIAEQVYGDFVIESITAEVKQVDMWGKPVAIYCTITLTEYREKRLQTREIRTTKKKAPAKKNSQQQVQPSQYKPIITR